MEERQERALNSFSGPPFFATSIASARTPPVVPLPSNVAICFLSSLHLQANSLKRSSPFTGTSQCKLMRPAAPTLHIITNRKLWGTNPHAISYLRSCRAAALSCPLPYLMLMLIVIVLSPFHFHFLTNQLVRQYSPSVKILSLNPVELIFFFLLCFLLNTQEWQYKKTPKSLLSELMQRKHFKLPITFCKKSANPFLHSVTVSKAHFLKIEPIQDRSLIIDLL